MENQFKHKIASLFRSSFRSCKTKNIPDDIENIDILKPAFHPQTPPHLFSDHLSLLSRTKNSPEFPPAPLPSRRRNTKFPRRRTRKLDLDFQDFPEVRYNGLFSSDEETEEDEEFPGGDRDTLFSSEFSGGRRAESRRRRWRRRRVAEDGVKVTRAVVKQSRDPHGDFRASMLEMIMEKQIFGAKDLEKLLQCFLYLNSLHLHGVIIEVFKEICEALFSNFCP
ncbi:hypothetical protein DM860_004126 [Cuscuta australis]|uniref:Transcription repressor n=1 Tax=Cuscuta australis TaxID=267555 RepID=A0A328CVR9_9ASTE|nr:hypothetical protein DM860_004126 [Cuscuta australis]